MVADAERVVAERMAAAEQAAEPAAAGSALGSGCVSISASVPSEWCASTCAANPVAEACQEACSCPMAQSQRESAERRSAAAAAAAPGMAPAVAAGWAPAAAAGWAPDAAVGMAPTAPELPAGHWPRVFLLGTQKAATSALFKLLEREEFACPTARKEEHFFDAPRNFGADNVTAAPGRLAAYRRRRVGGLDGACRLRRRAARGR